jgi:zinc/manganese transport system permease protein
MTSLADVVAVGATFSWNPLTDWQLLTSQAFMRNALLAGTIAAVVGAVVGHFVVLRGLTFAADGLTHVGFAGASGAVLVGVTPVAGLLALTMGAAVGIAALEQRLRGRDVVIGMILIGALGLGVLFLSLSSGYSNQAYALLFGDILALGTRELLVLGGAGVIALVAVGVLYRPLLLATLDPEVAESRGVRVRALGTAFLLIVALAATAATQVIGALLAVALIVGPAASAQQLTQRPARVVTIAVVLGVVIVWTGLALGYWLPFPVSFFITALVGLAYGVTRAVADMRERRSTRSPGAATRTVAA